MNSLLQLSTWARKLKSSATMPTFFIGHGSPMNALEDNDFTASWKQLGLDMPRPQGILVISAHWLSQGSKVCALDKPATIHDFAGFPQALFDVQYPAPGAADLARETQKLITKTEISLDHDWGLDHGTWSVLCHMYPEADIPCFQLSIDWNREPAYHFALGQELASLRNKGVLIIGSGNVVHNLRLADWAAVDKPGYGFDWALEFDQKVASRILAADFTTLLGIDTLGKAAKLAVPTLEHYLPLLYVAGAAGAHPTDTLIFNQMAVAGSLTMTSYGFT